LEVLPKPQEIAENKQRRGRIKTRTSLWCWSGRGEEETDHGGTTLRSEQKSPKKAGSDHQGRKEVIALKENTASKDVRAKRKQRNNHPEVRKKSLEGGRENNFFYLLVRAQERSEGGIFDPVRGWGDKKKMRRGTLTPTKKCHAGLFRVAGLPVLE